MALSNIYNDKQKADRKKDNVRNFYEIKNNKLHCIINGCNKMFFVENVNGVFKTPHT